MSVTRGKPARAAAAIVSSRATSSNDAGIVNTTSCDSNSSLRCAAFQA
jgi:hypothetical protein